MKNVFIFLALVLIFTSCKNASLMKRKYTDGYYFSKTSKVKTNKSVASEKETNKSAASVEVEKIVVNANTLNKTTTEINEPQKALMASNTKELKNNLLKSTAIKPIQISKLGEKNKSNSSFSNKLHFTPPQAGQGGGGFVAAIGGFFISMGFLFLYLGALTLEPALVGVGIGLIILGFLISMASLMMVFNVFPGI